MQSHWQFAQEAALQAITLVVDVSRTAPLDFLAPHTLAVIDGFLGDLALSDAERHAWHNLRARVVAQEASTAPVG